jgi:hypothetical protein
LLSSRWPALQPSIVTATDQRAGVSAEALADDEAYWGLVAQVFAVDGRYVVLNGGGQNPPARTTRGALTRGETYAAARPRPNNDTLLAQIEPHRQRLARHLGVTADPGAPIAAIGQVLDFHEAIRPERMAACMRHLLQVLLEAIDGAPGITVYTDRVPPRRSGLARITVAG